MSKQLLVAGIVACLICAPLMAQSVISYEIHLGGDNHYLAWENFENPAFTPGTLTDGAVFDCDVIDCTTLTWDVTVMVAGLHSTDGFDTHGAANLVFDLELQDNQGQLVEGVIFHSTINDGELDGLRGSIMDDPLEMAAFCLVFGQDANSAIAGAGPPDAPGRAFDDEASGGPYMRRAQFPTVGTHGGGRIDQAGNWIHGGTPAAGLSNGKLIGMGCGYPQFNAVENGGPATAGVGIDPWEFNPSSFSCERGLGYLTIFEGQMDITQLCGGDYTLVLTASAGNNIMPGSYDCQFGTATAFAQPADQVVGDLLTFTKLGICDPPPQIVAWRSVRDHGPECGELAIELDPSIESGCPVTEPRQGGIQRIEIDFESDATSFYMPNQAILSGGTASIANEALVNGGTRLVLDIDGSTDQTCYHIDLSPSFYAWEGDMDCLVATLAGDTNNDCIVSSLDRAQGKAGSGPYVPDNPRLDVNTDCIVSALDRAFLKAMSGHSVNCP
jgi:hypothetical protein